MGPLNPEDEKASLAWVDASIQACKSELRIRYAEVEDTPQLVALAMRFATEHPLGSKWSGATPAKLESVLVPLVLSLGVCVVAERDGAMVGLLALVKAPSYMGDDIFAEEVAWWVNPEERGRAGILLVNAALAWCSAEQVDVVKMSVPFGSEVGKVLERRGFEATEIAFLLRLSHVPVQLEDRDGSGLPAAAEARLARDDHRRD
jgi:hypothetical protein